MTEEKEPSEFTKALDKLINQVEERVTRQISNHMIDFVNERMKSLELSNETTEFDYCEKVGRIKELHEVLKELRELN
jgi:hypothetical protein